MRFLLCLITLISTALSADERILPLGNFGSVRYTYDDAHLLQIDRLASSGKVLYTHAYSWDEEGRLVSEDLIGDLGSVRYEDGILLPKNYRISSSENRHTPDQEAISDLVKGSGKKGVSNADADTLLDWAKEYDFPLKEKM